MRAYQFAYAGWDNLEFEEWQRNMRYGYLSAIVS